MTVNKDNSGKATGFIETFASNECIVTVNQSQYVTTVTTRDRRSGQIKMETFYGNLPSLRKD